MQESTQKPHSVALENRSVLCLTGVKDVPGFDEQTVSLETSFGNLYVKGENLHITKLSLETGDVTVDGKINSLQYVTTHEQKGFISKIFR